MTKCPFPHWLGQPNVILVVWFASNLLTMIEKKARRILGKHNVFS